MSKATQEGARRRSTFVVGWADDGQGALTVCAPNSVKGSGNMRPDADQAITRGLCIEWLAEARAVCGRGLYRIDVHDSIWGMTPGNEFHDWAEKCYRDKKYVYDSRSDTLTIFDRDRVVYINERGAVLRGDAADVAHWDSLDV